MESFKDNNLMRHLNLPCLIH